MPGWIGFNLLLNSQVTLFVLLMPQNWKRKRVSPADKFQFKRMNSGIKHKLIE